MKTVSAPLLDYVTNGYINEVGIAVHAEWQHNRFYRTVVDNTPSEDTDGYDIEMFPIESITMNNRPTAGINKAVVGQAYVEPEFHDSPPNARYYICSVNDQYKYWQSPLQSASTTPYAMTNCAPQVTYVEEADVSGSPVPLLVTANKVYFTVENTYATAVTYDVQVKFTTTGAWTTISSNVAIPSNGKLQLWYNGSSWTDDKVLGHNVTLSAVRVVVNRMDKTAYFNLIELGAALELDVSADVTDFSITHTMGEPDFITPLGNISANTGKLTLFNETRLYSDDNPSSILYNLIDKGVWFRGWYDYDTELVQEFEMISDSWSETESDVTVSLTDNTKVLMDTKPAAVLYQKMPVQECIWRICDLIGFNNYQVTAIDLDPHAIIDVFWTTGDKSAWETFGDLARATQTAIYFDAFGKLQVKTRGAAWNQARPVDFILNRNSTPGGTPASIISLDEKTDYESNKVTVNWKPTGFSEMRDNVVPFDIVWQPDGDVVLRSTPIASAIRSTSLVIPLPQAEGSTWPFSGICQIDGEWISYEGKQYIYYDETNTRLWATVKDLATQQRLDAKTGPNYRHLNAYTGELAIKQRGLYNTEARDHTTTVDNWTYSRRLNFTTNVSPCNGIAMNNGQSSLSIEGVSFDERDYTYLHRGATTDSGFFRLGTRIKIDNTAHREKAGGIFFCADGGLGTGYFLEVTATARLDSRMRDQRNEIVLYSMKSDGTRRQYGGQRIVVRDRSQNHPGGATYKRDIGAQFAVPMDTYVDLDVIVNTGWEDVIQVYADGQFLMECVVPHGSTFQHSNVGFFGLYAHGHSRVTFDYVYAVPDLGEIPLDDESFLDRIEGGYHGYQWQLDWTYQVRQAVVRVKKKWTKVLQLYNQRVFDEFGPIAHEVRIFDVKFSSATPSLESKLYFSNTTQAVCTEFWSDPMTAHFMMANISRYNAVINGDDTLTAGGEGTINHKLFVYGRPVIQKDAQQIVKTDDWALRRRGAIETEYDSPWIQNEAEANLFADWLTTHWSRSDSTLELEIFGNPLLELTDVAHVNYLDINADYYVIGVENSYSAGLTSKVTLRKI